MDRLQIGGAADHLAGPAADAFEQHRQAPGRVWAALKAA